MIHFFPRFSSNAADTPFGAALRAIGVEHRIHAASAPQHYRRRIELLLLGYPALAATAFRSARKSLLGRDGPKPDAVLLSSDVEVLVFALVRLLPWAAKARIVWMPFIFTARESGFVNRLRLLYYRFVTARVDCAICHSSLEVARYERMFAGCGTAFVFVRWGTYVPPVDEILDQAGPLPPPGARALVVAAGKSGRDYKTLAAAAARVPCDLTIVCNDEAALAGIEPRDGVELLRNCFGRHYLLQVLRADIVAVPLRVTDISAGQMVVIQAMALGKPVIVTSTPTIGDYLEDGVTALLVPRGDVAATEAAIRRLVDDPAFARALAARARQAYIDRFSGEAHLRAVVAAIEARTAAATA